MLHPLKQVAQALAGVAKSARTAAVFDLDSTLFCVSPRSQAILRRLSAEPDFQQRFQAAADVLREIEVLPTDWGVKGVLQRAQIGSDPELFRAVRNYWRQHFFANHFLEHDTIYPSANQYVQSLQQLGVDILYLTGRSQHLMRDGTLKMLSHWGFPLASETNLYMKTNDVMTDEGYKAQVLRDLVKTYPHIWFFENEPLIIEQVRSLVPQVQIIFVDSTHAGRAVPPTDLPTIGMSYREGLE